MYLEPTECELAEAQLEFYFILQLHRDTPRAFDVFRRFDDTYRQKRVREYLNRPVAQLDRAALS